MEIRVRISNHKSPGEAAKIVAETVYKELKERLGADYWEGYNHELGQAYSQAYTSLANNKGGWNVFFIFLENLVKYLNSIPLISSCKCFHMPDMETSDYIIRFDIELQPKTQAPSVEDCYDVGFL